MRAWRAAGGLAAWLLIGPALPAAAQAPRPEYLYQLSSFSGTVPYNQVALHVDEAHNEVYVGEGEVVRIYNSAGMEEHEFLHDARLGTILDLVVDDAGDVLVLSFEPPSPESKGGSVVTRYDFRGRPRGAFRPRDLPAGLEDFGPNRLVRAEKKLFFISRFQMLVARADAEGRVERVWDLGSAAEAADPGEEDDRRRPGNDQELGGFALDRQGRFLFTIPVRFRAFRMDPENGQTLSFGRPGSTPGKFSIAAGIAADDGGYVYVADRGRGVLLVFDPGLRFVREFGDAGRGVPRLARPGAIALGNGRLYVAQMGSRGVSVFSVGSPGESHDVGGGGAGGR